jgi:hypothetical protein
MRNIVLLALVAVLSIAATPAPRQTTTVAPQSVEHSIALFLGSLSAEGGRQVTFKARASGIRFYFEEPTGVTVYRFQNGRYVREEFLRNVTLEKAVKRYASGG